MGGGAGFIGGRIRTNERRERRAERYKVQYRDALGLLMF